MRITGSMITNGMMLNINRNSNALNRYYSNMASGKKVSVPSDNPLLASRALKFRTNTSQTEQYMKNLNQGMAWAEVTEGAFQNINNLMFRIRDLATRGASDTVTYEDRQKIMADINALNEQLSLETGATYAGRYVFSGYRTDTPPVITENSPDSRYEDVKVYYSAKDVECVTRTVVDPSNPEGTSNVEAAILKLPYTHLTQEEFLAAANRNGGVWFDLGPGLGDARIKINPVSRDYNGQDGPYEIGNYIQETGELVLWASPSKGIVSLGPAIMSPIEIYGVNNNPQIYSDNYLQSLQNAAFPAPSAGTTGVSITIEGISVPIDLDEFLNDSKNARYGYNKVEADFFTKLAGYPDAKDETVRQNIFDNVGGALQIALEDHFTNQNIKYYEDMKLYNEEWADYYNEWNKYYADCDSYNSEWKTYYDEWDKYHETEAAYYNKWSEYYSQWDKYYKDKDYYITNKPIYDDWVIHEQSVINNQNDIANNINPPRPIIPPPSQPKPNPVPTDPSVPIIAQPNYNTELKPFLDSVLALTEPSADPKWTTLPMTAPPSPPTIPEPARLLPKQPDQYFLPKNGTPALEDVLKRYDQAESAFSKAQSDYAAANSKHAAAITARNGANQSLADANNAEVRAAAARTDAENKETSAASSHTLVPLEPPVTSLYPDPDTHETLNSGTHANPVNNLKIPDGDPKEYENVYDTVFLNSDNAGNVFLTAQREKGTPVKNFEVDITIANPPIDLKDTVTNPPPYNTGYFSSFGDAFFNGWAGAGSVNYQLLSGGINYMQIVDSPYVLGDANTNTQNSNNDRFSGVIFDIKKIEEGGRGGLLKGELNPQIYFNCIDKTVLSPTYNMLFNAKFDNLGDGRQYFEFEVGPAARIRINSNAVDVISDKLKAGFQSKILELNWLNDVASREDVIKTIRANNPGDTEEQIEDKTAKFTQKIQESAQRDFSNLIGLCDKWINEISIEHTDLGSRMMRMDLIEERLKDDAISYAKLQAENEDADYAQTMTKLAALEAIYQASLKTSGSIMKLTLADYI